MSGSGRPKNLEEAIRQSGEGWLIDSFVPRDGGSEHLRRILEQVNQAGRQRLGTNAPDLTEQALVESFIRHPASVRAFLQALSRTNSHEMLLMVWRIIQGMEIEEIQLEYRRQESLQLRVVLVSPLGGQREVYESTNINDFALLRHIGTMEISGKPVFDGFYPLNVG